MAFTDGFLYHTQAFCSVQAVEFVIKHGPGSFTSVLTEMDSLTGVIRLTNCWGGEYSWKQPIIGLGWITDINAGDINVAWVVCLWNQGDGETKFRELQL